MSPAPRPAKIISGATDATSNDDNNDTSDSNTDTPIDTPPPSPPPGNFWAGRVDDFINFYSDPEWYDRLGGDPFTRNKIWEMTDPTEQTNAVLELLEKFPYRGLWMLFESAVRGNLHLVRALLHAGVPPHCGGSRADDDDDKSQTDNNNDNDDDDSLVPIHAAAFHGHVECVKALVEEGGVDPDIPDGTGTPLMRAHMTPHMHVIRYLLSTGRINLRRRQFFKSTERHPLEWILWNGNAESATMLAEALWEQGEPREVPPEAIEAAAEGEEVGNLRFALSVGGYPDPDAVVWGETSLSAQQRAVLVRAAACAAQAVRLNTLKLALRYLDKPGELFVPQVEEKEAFRVGVLNAAEKDAETFDFVFNILCRSSFYTEEERKGDLADSLFAAAYTNCLPMVPHLIEKHKADPNTASQTQKLLPLGMAAMNGCVPTVQYLIQDAPIKADIHLGGGEHGLLTALWYALRERREKVVGLLLRHGGPVDGVHPEDTPLDFRESGESIQVKVVSFMNERREVRVYTTKYAFENADLGDARSTVTLKLERGDEDWWRKLEYRGLAVSLNYWRLQQIT
ncbi:ankyrin repeat-containing domain protein [Apodospora peruviana]|uniref:Ankyrin repeat-containing domain protein n=1 Tax=Apodospora peruviana TaxID=516989 RepID=A0AAE0M501_9PEZI|nr:ankyrin repeat-containing domain protein [Apodospora peruviana]